MRKLLLPISFLYSLILRFRHWCYDSGLQKVWHFNQPIICIGNLNLGGTGKTPHTEYLIKLLKDHYKVAILSRGYGRKTKGFVIGDNDCDSSQLGDEPMLYLQKYHDITVAVDEDRVEGINKLTSLTNPDVILLDDAFQHRKVDAGLNILLTDYNHLYCDDYLIPAGNLRDIQSAAHRADIILVSKSPQTITEEDSKKIAKKLKIKRQQNLFFSYLDYEPLRAMNEKAGSLEANSADSVLLFSGIANPKPLIKYLNLQYNNIESISFTDHHFYSKKDIMAIVAKYKMMVGSNKIIVTTEKDAARMINSDYLCLFESVPLFVAPVQIRIIEEEKFNKEIKDYVRENTRDCCVSAQDH